MPAPDDVRSLVERFHRNRESYGTAAYNETQARREFIDPLFTALGWDVDNKAGYAEAYKDVIHEDAIKVGGATKAPDYCFRVGGQRKFFVEAKKPGVAIKTNAEAAYQLRRYAWSAKLPLSILTDFEEFAVYDCRIKPSVKDKASTARILYLTYDEYEARWDEIGAVFSKQAVLEGRFDRFGEAAGGKRGTGEVDTAFLREIETWRKDLAGNLASRNPTLSQDELNFAVGRTIDRLIFLRITEDRGIEPYGQLLGVTNGTNIYQRFFQLCRAADAKYNSGLFHFRRERGRLEPDELTPRLVIDDKILKRIIEGLYYPVSPYEFSVLPADILGQVYEQFLGKVIQLGPRHQATVVDKPEVKKAGGVYYTPTYVVAYIVAQTVGRWLQNKTPREAAVLRILDPACGSGSFLIGAYQYLLDWHRDYYLDHNQEKNAQDGLVYLGPGGVWRLGTREKKRILLNSILGVDVDAQAVEVTKLSLLLKVLEGENADSLDRQLKLFRERALPDLDHNIKCGNSLLGSDFVNGLDLIRLRDNVTDLNCFNWRREFPAVFEAGGFDAVIGNPPYGASSTDAEAWYLARTYETYRRIPDSYVAFVEQAHRLLKDGGRFGFITPSAWLGGPRYRPVREWLLSKTIESLVLLPFDVFRDAYIDTAIVITANADPRPQHRVAVLEYPKRAKIARIAGDEKSFRRVPQRAWLKTEDKKFILDAGMLTLLARIRARSSERFADQLEMVRGVLFDAGLLTKRPKTDAHLRYFEGDVYRYAVNWKADRWVEYGPKMKEYPRDPGWFKGERILLRRLVNRQRRLMATVVHQEAVNNKNLYVLRPLKLLSANFCLGVLNSRLVARMYLAQVSQATKDDFPQVTIKDIMALPFPTVDLNDPAVRKKHDRLVKLVQALLDTNDGLGKARTSHQSERLRHQAEALDQQIDALVNDLYGLTSDEVKILEGEA